MGKMKLVYQGPADHIALNIGEYVVYHRDVPFDAIGGYASHLMHKLHPHRFAVVEGEPEATAEPEPPRKRVGRKPKE